ncbi:hypothetical protein cyc_05043 [Cyclospora cayetanensis]|uniref:Uncharacterized protein n=1 Tax=Cyclospora cayetanensis TaxID=88456 RepID=A0A1D3D6T5_9EIME|nr:hypothetical protein cyc_05043 [Cyclospora cayetanensis]
MLRVKPHWGCLLVLLLAVVSPPGTTAQTSDMAIPVGEGSVEPSDTGNLTDDVNPHTHPQEGEDGQPLTGAVDDDGLLASQGDDAHALPPPQDFSDKEEDLRQKMEVEYLPPGAVQSISKDEQQEGKQPIGPARQRLREWAKTHQNLALFLLVVFTILLIKGVIPAEKLPEGFDLTKLWSKVLANLEETVPRLASRRVG